MKRLLKTSAIALCVFLAACASNVKRTEVTGAEQLTPTAKCKNVSITLNDEAKKKLSDNLKFNAETLRGTVQRALEAQDLIQKTPDQAAYGIEIVITDVRVRSNFTAIMFGFMAGADSVTGDVQVKDASGKLLKKFEVSASYALGGIGGGQDEARMGWLYEKFTEQTLNELRTSQGKNAM